jgi:hypothetical protein
MAYKFVDFLKSKTFLFTLTTFLVVVEGVTKCCNWQIVQGKFFCM